MGNCICCNKYLGRLSISFQLLEDNDSEFCMDCYNYFNDDFIHLKAAETPVEFSRYYNLILQKIESKQCNERAKKAILTYIDRLKDEKMDLSGLYDEQTTSNQNVFRSEVLKKIKDDFLMTTGFNFEGYEIISYKDILNTSVVMGTGFLAEVKGDLSDFFGATSNGFSKKIDKARDLSKERIIDKAIAQGCNAIIGIDFDYITLDNNMIGVIASGTGVVIKPILIETK